MAKERETTFAELWRNLILERFLTRLAKSSYKEKFILKVGTLLAKYIHLGLHAELFFTPEMISTHLKPYTENEIQLLEKDLNVVRSICLDNSENTEIPFYLATAGAPQGDCMINYLTSSSFSL